ncbi:hypothetical protein CRV08_02015 [Halarcobacter ebronensis]|uniref:Uncharacterized protein n=1 Tax=Halarcobacter ebronensis TaxID=1462615 RepID=A0A4Q0YKE9_9BACT|nr:hypothetical protein [Halarcobacter ebronensis]RXJ69501.1 hypothetical protein CRV08_02015 [Halarcobacter ebronensis]
MSICEKTKIELFDDFYDWLKKDGLKPKRSERLHRKKIFAALLSNDAMTLENFTDFQIDHLKAQILALKGVSIQINGNVHFILDIALEVAQNEFIIKAKELYMRCKFENLQEIQKLIIK